MIPENRTDTMHLLIKIGAACLAFVPMFVLIFLNLLRHAGIFTGTIGKAILIGCSIFNYPAFSVMALINTFHVSSTAQTLSALALMLVWSSFMAWFFWKAAESFLGEDEPDDRQGKYDWVGFQVRFVIGFVIGFLVGWRFVKYSTSVKTLLIASCVTGFIGGLLYGLSRPPDFWSRT